MPREKGRKVVASNRKARHDYSILDTYEAGIALTGTEVKSLRAGRASLVDAFGHVDGGEIFLHGMHIRGKRSYDKRQDLAKRDAEREISKVAGRRGKGMS